MVFAATSLTDAFNKIGSQFEAANSGVTHREWHIQEPPETQQLLAA